MNVGKDASLVVAVCDLRSNLCVDRAGQTWNALAQKNNTDVTVIISNAVCYNSNNNNINSIMNNTTDNTTNSPHSIRFLEQLPPDALRHVLDWCADMKTLQSLAAMNSVLRESVHQQDWKCHGCSDRIFVNATLETLPHTHPYTCTVCRQTYCGQAIDYDKRRCRPQHCDGCGTIECLACVRAHQGDEYGTETLSRMSRRIGCGYGRSVLASVDHTDLKHTSIPRFRRTLTYSFGFAVTVYIVIVAACYGTFGGNSSSDMLNNYSSKDPFASLARVCFFVSTLLNYPLALRNVRDCYSDLLQVFNETRVMEETENLQATGGLRSLFMILTVLLLALEVVVDDLGLINVIGGGAFATYVCVIFPCLLYRETVLQSYTKDHGEEREVLLAMVLAVVATLLGMLGVCQSLSGTLFLGRRGGYATIEVDE